MRPTEYDVLIVGARVAGATLAALLGEAGWRVLLVDRARFPSPTLSTHFFRGGRAGRVLERLGVLDEVLALGCPRLVGEYRFHPGQVRAALGPPQEPGALGYGLSVRRGPLDALLVRRALATGRVEVLEATSVRSLAWGDGRVVGACLRGPDGDHAVRARCTVGADGRRSFVARAVAAPLQSAEAGHRGFYYRYVRDWRGPTGQPPDGAEFHHAPDERAYVFPSDAGLSCVALSLNRDAYVWLRQAPAERFPSRLASYAGLAERLGAARWTGPLLGCGPLPNYVRVPVGRGWALLGDAGLHQDPWSGLGIDQAMVQATLLSAALEAWLAGAQDEAEAFATYHRCRDADALPRYERTVSLSRNLGSGTG